jgi:hypothetical protein
VSLRGIGPSGVSRTLVLLDGVPFNDPFGGVGVLVEGADGERRSHRGGRGCDVEPVRQLRDGRRHQHRLAGADARTLEFKTQIGNRKSPKIDLFAGDAIGRLAFAVDASAFRTDGYPTVIESERGKVDNNASVNFNNLTVRADYAVNHQLRTFFRAGTFREDRDNGKASTIDGTEEANKTRWTSVSGGIRAGLGTSQLVASLFGDFETFRSNFLAVPAANPPRSLGRMTLNQRVPTHATGALAQWARGIGAQHYVTVGADWRWVDGDSEEDGLDADVRTERDPAPCLRRNAAAVRHLRPGSDHAGLARRRHAGRAAGSLAQLRRSQPRDESAERHADGGQQPESARAGRYGGEPARRCAVSRERSCDGVGQLRIGLSRAHAETSCTGSSALARSSPSRTTSSGPNG